MVQGKKSGSYRELKLHSLVYENTPLSIQELFSQFLDEGRFKDLTIEPFKFWDFLGLTVAYLATYLTKREISVDFVSSFQNDKEFLKEKLLTNEILSIVITTTLYATRDPITEIIQFIKQYNTEAKIILGGPFVQKQTRFQDERTVQYIYKNLGADFYINNAEGEKTLVELISRLKQGEDYQQLNNLGFRQNEAFVINPHEPELNSLDQEVVDWSQFSDRAGRFAIVRTSISCPFSCSFCSYPERMGKFRTANLESVEKELDSLNDVEQVSCVYFVDDTFNIPKKRFKELLKLLVRKQYRFKWYSFLRCQYADEETLELMREGGCEGVILGIESASDLVLKNLNKKVTVAEYERGMKLIKQSGIMCFASMLIGFPGETEQSVQESIDFIKKFEPDFYRFHLWYCDPFSPIWEQKETYQIKGFQHDWSHLTMNSQEAADLMEKAFLEIGDQQSIWLPQNGFQFDGVFQMLHNGISIGKIKNYIRAFNLGVRDRLFNSEHDNLSKETYQKIIHAFSG